MQPVAGDDEEAIVFVCGAEDVESVEASVEVPEPVDAAYGAGEVGVESAEE